MARVRLGPRVRSRPEDGWLRPDSTGRWTTVGNLDSPVRVAVDPTGGVARAERGWSLEWWIGAEDRWHVPANEVTVRQRLVDDCPVVETRVRVPGGDAVEHVYAARGSGGRDVLVVELHNDSRLPFAVALALRPWSLAADGGVGRVEVDGTAVRVDGEVARVLPRPPGRSVLATAAGGDAAAVVFDGRAEPMQAGEVRCPEGLAHAVLLFPLAHAATLRVAVPLGQSQSSGGVDLALDSLPDAERVARGWGLQARRGARLEVPDRRLREAIAASTRFLLLGAADPAAAAALDLMGFADEAAAGLLADTNALSRTERPGLVLHALARHWALTRDVEMARTAAPLVAALVAALARTTDPAEVALGGSALPRIADLLDGAGEALGASDARAISVPHAEVPDGPSVDELLATASPTWTWSRGGIGHDLAANAELISQVRQRLVREVDGGLALSPAVPGTWLGMGWEVHDAPTAHGRLSYAVRWHKDRPALLWELDPHPGQPPARLTAPALDGDWSSIDRRGDALLAPVDVPMRPQRRRGLTIPVTIEPAPHQR